MTKISGDVYPGREPADMIFILAEKHHPYFKREGNDLVYTSTINLRQALNGIKLNIQTLDGSNLNWCCFVSKLTSSKDRTQK